MDATLLESSYQISQCQPLAWLFSGIRKQARVLAAALLLLVSLPLFLLVAFLIKLTSNGPVFYRRLEKAEDETLYYAYEFRTTVNGSFPNRLTTVGGFLRAGCLNQLPRLINVVEGNARFNLRLLEPLYAKG